MKDFMTLEEMHGRLMKKPGFKVAYEKEMARFAQKEARMRRALLAGKSPKKRVVV